MKRWINFFLLLVLLVMTLALLRDYILPESHVCQYNRKLYPCNPPLAGADVEELQLRLRELGFYGGEINGIYDEDTVLAVEEAQLALELEPTGEAELSYLVTYVFAPSLSHHGNSTHQLTKVQAHSLGFTFT